MVIRIFGKHFDSLGGALTLDSSVVGVNTSGWTVKGQIHEDYYEWVNEFSASHPEYGRVWGNFETVVKATSKKSFRSFL